MELPSESRRGRPFSSFPLWRPAGSLHLLSGGVGRALAQHRQTEPRRRCTWHRPEASASTTTPTHPTLFPWMLCWFVEQGGLRFLPFPQPHQILHRKVPCGLPLEELSFQGSRIWASFPVAPHITDFLGKTAHSVAASPSTHHCTSRLSPCVQHYCSFFGVLSKISICLKTLGHCCTEVNRSEHFLHSMAPAPTVGHVLPMTWLKR